jgi:sulfate adenylyltransferase
MNDKDNQLISYHGDKSVNCLVEKKIEKKMEGHKGSLPKIKLSTLEFSDLIMLGIGAFSPLDGFIKKADYESILDNMHLRNGILWPIPITLSITKEEASSIKIDSQVNLISPYSDEIVGLITAEEMFPYNKKAEAKSVFGTDDSKHPGVEKLYKRGDYYLGGKVEVYSEGGYPEKFSEYARPSEVRKIFKDKGWKVIVAFQTRNPLHRSHEYLTKIALEMADGLFLHPIVGNLKKGDIPAEIRIKCYKVLLDKYYPKDRVVLKVYPMEMRYAGPKEAVLHAVIRQNYGCTHLIIGRDHAGVGDYYGAFDAQNIFDKFSEDELKIKPLRMDWSFYCSECKQMASKKTCPHDSKYHKIISGTKLREMLSEGIRPPDYVTRPEVSDILIDYYKKLGGNKNE